MASLGSTDVSGDLKVTGDVSVLEDVNVEKNINSDGMITEGGNRVFSPNNRNISDSVTSTSTSVYANSAAAKKAYDRGTEALNKANEKLDADATAANSSKLGNQAPSYYAKSEDLSSLSESRKFTRSSTITNFRRHSLGAGTYTAPSLRADGSALQDQDWFSVRAVSGEPVLNIKNGVSAKFKRLSDGAVDTQVTIVADDKNERVFVFNKTDNLWEF